MCRRPSDRWFRQAGASFIRRGLFASHELLSVSPHEGEHPILYAHAAPGTTPGTGFLLQRRAVAPPQPPANASEPACLPADVVASASRPQHGTRWHDPLLAVAPERDQELARQRDNPNPAQP